MIVHAASLFNTLRQNVTTVALGAKIDGPFGFNVLVPFFDLDVVDAAAARWRCIDCYHGPVDAVLVERVQRRWGARGMAGRLRGRRGPRLASALT